MASDLATALISGTNTGLMADPAIAAIAPQLQLGQGLATQGMSTAPAYPAQALGRLAQALAGTYLMGDAQHQLGALTANSTEELAKIFPAGTPMGDAVRSPSPLVRMMAAQQAPKALLLGSESQKLGPSDVIVSPGTARQGGGTVATGAPSQAGAVEAAKNPALVQRAGGVAAAESPYKEGGTITVETPRGREQIPATAATRAAMQPGGVASPAAVPTAVPGAGQAGAHGGIGGQPVQTPERAGDIKSKEELYGGVGGALSKVVGGVIERGDQAARDKMNALDTMESALRAGGNNVFTGPLADHALKAKQLLDSLGVPNTSDLVKGLPQTEIVAKMNAQLSSAAAKAMTGRPTQAEFQIWMKNNPGLLTSKQGTLALIDVIRQQTKQDMELSGLAQKAYADKKLEQWPQIASDYYSDPKHGLTNPLTGHPMRDEIAAARANPNSTPAKAVPSVGQVVDGFKFNGGDPRDQKNWTRAGQ